MADPAPAKEQAESTVKELTLEGYNFNVDTDLLDDVEAFETIDRIENKGQSAAIVELLTYLIGRDGYDKMKAHFTEADAKEHEGVEGYKPRFRATKMTKVYEVIVKNFDPKG